MFYECSKRVSGLVRIIFKSSGVFLSWTDQNVRGKPARNVILNELIVYIKSAGKWRSTPFDFIKKKLTMKCKNGIQKLLRLFESDFKHKLLFLDSGFLVKVLIFWKRSWIRRRNIILNSPWQHQKQSLAK